MCHPVGALPIDNPVHAMIHVSMHVLDLAVIVAYLVGITWFGTRFKKSQRSLKDYFLGGRNAPWWAISFSIVSAETSTLTVIGTPALAFAGNYGFLQLILGYLLGRIVISVLFLPQYFRGELFTAYELMERRFGTRIRKFTAGTFLLAAGDGRRGARLRGFDRDFGDPGHGRSGFHSGDRLPDTALHV